MNNNHNRSSTPIENSPIDWEYTCNNCSRAFDATMAHQIVVRGPHVANIMCPWCKKADDYHPPEEIERPPAVVGTSITTTDGLTTARMFFEGGAWLQYRQTPDGRVREEMFDADGEEIESFNAEIEHDDCDLTGLYDPPEAYLHSAVEQYEKYTVRGIRIRKPHIYAVLVDDH